MFLAFMGIMAARRADSSAERRVVFNISLSQTLLDMLQGEH
jgi:hypothetical protein